MPDPILDPTGTLTTDRHKPPPPRARRRQDLPAAAICSDAFKVTADAIADLRGAPGYRYATTPLPVAVLTPDQVKERAAGVLDAVVALLTET